jgi:hypothetical protein
MTATSHNKYVNLERQIDEILSEGKIYIFPPGLGVFLLVNLLMVVGIAMLVLVSQDVIFDQMESAMIFSFVAGIALSLGIVTPPFLVLRGFRKAHTYLKYIIIALIILILLFAVLSLIKGSQFGIFSVIGFISMLGAYQLVKGDTYQLLSLFTARRRELALQKAEYLKNN